MPDYESISDQEARQVAIIVAERCRALGRPVAMSDINVRRIQSDRALLIRATKLGYLTVYLLKAVTLYMPVGWGFGPERGGCCR